jgi:hypothetical protein
MGARANTPVRDKRHPCAPARRRAPSAHAWSETGLPAALTPDQRQARLTPRASSAARIGDRHRDRRREDGGHLGDRSARLWRSKYGRTPPGYVTCLSGLLTLVTGRGGPDPFAVTLRRAKNAHQVRAAHLVRSCCCELLRAAKLSLEEHSNAVSSSWATSERVLPVPLW